SYKYMIGYSANIDKNKDQALVFADKALAVDPADAEVLANKDILSKATLRPPVKTPIKSDKITIAPDGTITTVGNDGSVTVIVPGGKITTVKDGITTIIENGKVTMLDKNGKVINQPPTPPGRPAPPKTNGTAPKKK
ncbi:MAG TPA: hypothetical protein PKG89_11810, partial [Ferruginibacter sp.]|nr:hypothetical protein [Ferruginibacter sp.]